MEYEKIKQLMDDMGNSKLTSIDIDFPDGTKISMKKESEKDVCADVSAYQHTSETQNSLEEFGGKQNTLEPEIGNVVKSPMVGTFYIKPSPTDRPYVEIGSEVKKGDTLCIIEAMKLMNEIESEYSGKITEILVKDGEAVGYGTPLFKIC